MKGAIYNGIEKVSIETIPEPICGDNDVILKNIKAGICGTDIGAYYHGGESAGIFPGHEFGHEMSSVIYKKGKNVPADIEIGMRVFPNPCVSKRPDCGLSLLSICDECGAFSEYVQIQDAKLGYNLFEIPENVSFDEAALIEPFAVAMHGVNIAKACKYDRVVIFGAGMIGLSTLAACIGKGIKEIVVVDVVDWRLEKAKKMGAIAFNSKTDGDLKLFLQEKYGGDLVSPGGQSAVDIDLFIDTAGFETIIPTIISMAKHRARLAIVALYHDQVLIDPYPLLCSEMEVVGSFAYQTKDIEEVIDYLAAKSTPIESIITHHFPLERINEAFEQATRSENTLKILIDHAQ